MTWLEQNIDAYRIVSDILGDLRRAIRDGLEAVYGEAWYRDGLPGDVFDRLVSAKEREKSIDWYEGQYQQVMDYAVFTDLVEILDHNPDYFPELMALAPSAALLQARFVELDVMRAKLGRARPISETELSFLGTFHVRFRKAISEMPVREPGVTKEAPAEEPTPEKPTPKRRATDRPPQQAPVEPPSDISSKTEPPEAEPAKPEMPESTPSPPSAERPQKVVARVAQPGADAERGVNDQKKPEDEAAREPPTRAVQSSAPKTAAVAEDEPAAEPDETGDTAEVVEKDTDEDASKPRAAVGRKKLAVALENDDHRTVLRELYREVTTIAEGVWSSDVTPAPLVWEQVTASEWYKNNFSRLGLQALSVFYEVTGNVEQMGREGATNKQLQEFLKESNFAKTLLALRDMFQANNL